MFSHLVWYKIYICLAVLCQMGVNPEEVPLTSPSVLCYTKNNFKADYFTERNHIGQPFDFPFYCSQALIKQIKIKFLKDYFFIFLVALIKEITSTFLVVL